MTYARARSWRLSLLSSAAALMLAMTACSPGGAPEPTGSENINTEAKLKVAWSVGITTLDPHLQNSDFLGARFGLNLIYDSLFTIDAVGHPQPNLIDAWEYINKGLTLTLSLREDATFHDGTPVDAAAVKANLDRARTLPSPVVQAQLAAVKDVRIVDPYNLELDLTAPTTTLPFALAMTAGYIMNPGLIASGDPSTEANGSGPYIVGKYTPGEALSLTRDADGYWNKDCCKFASIEYSQIADNQALTNAIGSGQLDIAGSLLPHQLPALENRTGVNIVRMTTGGSLQLAFNFAAPPLDDLRVRQAINLALNREVIVKALSPGSAPMYQYSRESVPGYVPQLDEKFAFDVEQAKDLLDEAGYGDGVDLGTILVGTQVIPGLVDVLIDQLGEVGITFTPETVEARQINTRFAEGKAAGLLNNFSGGMSPVLGAQNNWYTASRNPAGTTPEFDALFAAADNNQLSADGAEQAFQAMNQYTVEQAWRAPIALVSYGWVSRNDIRGISGEMDFASVHGGIDFRHVYEVR